MRHALQALHWRSVCFSKTSDLVAEHWPFANALPGTPSLKSLKPFTMSAESASASVSLKKIVDWDGSSQDIHQALITAFEANDYQSCIKDLEAHGIEPLAYVNGLDKVSLS